MTQKLYIAGIGGSAGALDALKKLVANLPYSDVELAIIVAQHMSAEHESKLHTLLHAPDNWQIKAALPNEKLKSQTVYIIPVGHEVDLRDGHIHIFKKDTKGKATPSIDDFFKSLAKVHGPLAIGVILSGTGQDGSAGLKAIKEAGGFTLVQDPDEASYNNMPRAAIQTGKADLIITADEMGEEIEKHMANAEETNKHPQKESSLLNILKMLSLDVGTDFSSYKASTVERRVTKRLGMLDLKNFEEYYQYMKENPAEVKLLFETMLIGVTDFFRDSAAFDSLKKYLKKIIEQKNPGDDIRLWSVGCATGEEAYSLTILLCETLGSDISKYNIRILATDIDDRALKFARKGVYKKEKLDGLSKKLLQKYFVDAEGGYQVRDSIRQYILFSRHDIISDPPFVRLDLVCCRNLLIYLTNDRQQQILPLFHYALKPGGFLFLGKSENASQMPDLFQQVDKQRKIYRSQSSAEINTLHYSNFRGILRKQSKETPSLVHGLSLEEIATQTLIKKYEHPYVVVDEDMEVRLIKGSLKPYLDISEGTLKSSLFKIINQEIHTELRICFTKAKRKTESCQSNIIHLGTEAGLQYLRLKVKPLIYTQSEKQHYLVIFEKVPLDELSKSTGGQMDTMESDEAMKIMEQELAATRDHLRSFTEELEVSKEELQSVNEELQSANEELKSANDELETSNDELQSANEKLEVANQACGEINLNLKEKEIELRKSKEFLENTQDRFETVLTNSRIYLAYHDRDLKYTWIYNHPVDSKEGSVIGKTDQELPDQDGMKLYRIKKEVLLSGEDFIGELQLGSSFWEMSIKPITKDGNVIGLKTVGFEITQRRQAMEETRKKQGIIDVIIDNVEDRMLVVDTQFKVLAVNKSQKLEFEERFGHTINEGDSLLELLKEFSEVRKKLKTLFSKAFGGEKIVIEKYTSLNQSKDGQPLILHLEVLPLTKEDGEIMGASLWYHDITDRIKTEQQIEHVIRHTANLSEEDFFNDLTDQMYSLYRARHVYFALYNESQNMLVSKAYRMDGRAAENISYDLNDTPCKVVIESQTSKNYQAAQETFAKDPKLAKWEAVAYQGIPIWSPVTGRILGVFVMVHDEPLPKIPNSDYLFNIISLRAGAELEAIQNLKEIKVRDKQLVSITNNLPQMIYEYISKDKPENDEFTFVSQGVEDIYEVRFQELYANPGLAWDSIYKDDFDSYVKALAHATDSLETLKWTGRIVGQKTYKLRWVKITARPEMCKDGFIKWHGAIDDISRIMHMELELKHAKELAEESAAAKEDFLNTMSHEIRTPLSGIVGITDIMIMEASQEQMEYLNLLKFSTENLMTLVNNILDFSKLNSGEIEVSETDLRLDLLLKNLMQSHSFRARENTTAISYKLDERVPEVLKGDPMVLLQILNNLIGNALKFTLAGRVDLQVTVTREKKHSMDLLFEINDTGVGISKEDLEKIFNKFQQVGDRNKNVGGTGLGLSISKRLVEALGGQLQVKSTVGKGSTFFFTISLKKLDIEEVEERLPKEESSFPEDVSLEMLLVEDVIENRTMLLKYFNQSDQLSIDAAANGEEAIEMVRNKDYDLVLMDLRMPVMDGYKATKIIRSWEEEKYRQLTIIALTADDVNRVQNHGFNGVVPKPFSPKELRDKILVFARDRKMDW